MTNADHQTQIEAWFAAQGWQPFDFQREVWSAYLNGESGLIHAATGTGKTYAAWIGPLIDWMEEHPSDASNGRKAPPLRILWITPLRALAADTMEALKAPLDALGIQWEVETRTGDTSSSARARQDRRLPTVLITTPESLTVLLARENSQELFEELRTVMVDEWHELLSAKRGVQTELALARLRTWHPDLKVWGLSATMGNLEVAMAALLGTGGRGRLVRGLMPKAIRIESILPDEIERFPWAGHLGLKLLPDVIRIIDEADSALVFTNTRNFTERWYQAILEARPDWAGIIAVHHGSLDQEVRQWVEDAMREGRLKAVVSTSTLELGVDFTIVDRVIQIGSPKGVGRLLQRTGRSGHQPGAESRITCVPTHAFELIEFAAARDAVNAGNIEARPPIEKPLDVLVQHMVTAALGGGFREDDLLSALRPSMSSAHAAPTPSYRARARISTSCPHR